MDILDPRNIDCFLRVWGPPVHGRLQLQIQQGHSWRRIRRGVLTTPSCTPFYFKSGTGLSLADAPFLFSVQVIETSILID
jgi:hypothetical protein